MALDFRQWASLDSRDHRMVIRPTDLGKQLWLLVAERGCVMHNAGDSCATHATIDFYIGTNNAKLTGQMFKHRK